MTKQEEPCSCLKNSKEEEDVSNWAQGKSPNDDVDVAVDGPQGPEFGNEDPEGDGLGVFEEVVGVVWIPDVVEDGEEEEEGVEDDVEERSFEGWVSVLNVHKFYSL